MAAKAVTQADLNIRTGPGIAYSAVAVVPSGLTVTILGCADSGRWCDVVWKGYRGWVSGNYLGSVRSQVPVVVYDPVIYEQYYNSRPSNNARVNARRDARVEYRVNRRMDRRWERWTD